MRPSPQRHTLAVLRTTIGLTQKEMAALLECSVPTIQAVELGKLKLSADLALRASLQTAVDPDWLRVDDVSKPPINKLATPYTKEDFENAQAHLKHKLGDSQLDRIWTYLNIFSTLDLYRATMRAALEKHQFQLFAYRVGRALETIAKDFDVKPPDKRLEHYLTSGTARPTAEHEPVIEALRKELQSLPKNILIDLEIHFGKHALNKVIPALRTLIAHQAQSSPPAAPATSTTAPTPRRAKKSRSR